MKTLDAEDDVFLERAVEVARAGQSYFAHDRDSHARFFCKDAQSTAGTHAGPLLEPVRPYRPAAGAGRCRKSIRTQRAACCCYSTRIYMWRTDYPTLRMTMEGEAPS